MRLRRFTNDLKKITNKKKEREHMYQSSTGLGTSVTSSFHCIVDGQSHTARACVWSCILFSALIAFYALFICVSILRIAQPHTYSDSRLFDRAFYAQCFVRVCTAVASLCKMCKINSRRVELYAKEPSSSSSSLYIVIMFYTDIGLQ